MAYAADPSYCNGLRTCGAYMHNDNIYLLTWSNLSAIMWDTKLFLLTCQSTLCRLQNIVKVVKVIPFNRSQNSEKRTLQCTGLLKCQNTVKGTQVRCPTSCTFTARHSKYGNGNNFNTMNEVSCFSNELNFIH